MSWRNPQYCYLHAARDAGAAAITAENAFHADYPKDFLIDDRAGSLCKFNTSETDHTITVDLGTGYADITISRIYIPVGHNMTGGQIGVQGDDNAGMTSPGSLLGYKSTVAATAFDWEFTTPSSERYIQLKWNPASGAGAWELPQLIFTATKTTTRGPEPGWVDMLRHNTLDFEKESGAIASLALGADRRFIEYVYRYVDASADLTVFADLLSTCGTSKPFLLDPAFDTEDAIWMKLTEDSRQQLDRAAPASPDSARPEIQLSMLEHLA